MKLVGGGSLLTDLDHLLRQETRLPILRSEDPYTAVVHGAGKALDDLKGGVYAADVLIDDTTAPGQATGKIKTHTAFGYATQVCILDGEGRVERFVAAHDVGRAVNPALCEGQIEGSIRHRTIVF